MDKPLLHEYLAAVREAEGTHPQWRSGQAHFNVLHSMRPDLSALVRTERLDPFYQDANLPAFLAFVGERW